MGVGAAIPLVLGLGGAAMGGSGGKKGGGGGSYPAGLNKILDMQAGTMKKFEPMTSEWANMGNAYMGIDPALTVGTGGWGLDSNKSTLENLRSYAAAKKKGLIPPAIEPSGSGVTPTELEDMPALRDLLYQPGGTNELLMRRQGGTARNQILENLPTGGVQQNAMAQQLRGENENLAGMRVDARQNAANMVLGGGPMLNPSTAMGGAASNTAGMAANAYAQQQQAKGTGMAGMGNMLGLIGGSAMQGKGGGGGK